VIKTNACMGMSMVLLVCMATAHHASAQPEPPRNAEGIRREAQTRLDEGLRRYDRGDFDGARVAFAQAYAVTSSAAVLWDLALSELHVPGRELEAIAHFRQYRALPPDPKAPSNKRALAEGHIEEAQRRIGRIAIVAPQGTSVVVDGQPVAGAAPFAESVEVTPGKHVVETRTDGHLLAIEVYPAAGQVVEARFEMGAGGIGGARAQSALAYDGRQASEPSQSASDARPGAMVWTPRAWTSMALGGGAVLALATGVGFTLAASSVNDRRNALIGPSTVCPGSPNCNELTSLRSEHDRDGTIAVVSFAAGGGLAAAAVATWFLWPKAQRPTAGLHWAPWGAPGPVGGSIYGTF
jgi:hypothetical protein